MAAASRNVRLDSSLQTALSVAAARTVAAVPRDPFMVAEMPARIVQLVSWKARLEISAQTALFKMTKIL